MKPSETETVILEIYLAKYIQVRLTNLFLIYVTKPFTDFIDFFESRRVRCHLRHQKMKQLVCDHLSRFLKENVTVLSIGDLLEIDMGEEKLMDNKKVMVGTGVTSLLQEMGMGRESPEVRPFMDSVFRFYIKSSQALLKYFKVPLSSRILR